jgi:hypothetical protein
LPSILLLASFTLCILLSWYLSFAGLELGHTAETRVRERERESREREREVESEEKQEVTSLDQHDEGP